MLAGKRVAVVASAVNVKAGDPTLHATLSTHGLEKLLAGYGIEMRRDVIEGSRRFRSRSRRHSSCIPSGSPT